MKFDIHAYSKFSVFDDAIKIKFMISLNVYDVSSTSFFRIKST